MKKFLGAIVVIFILAFGGYYLASPYLTLYQLKSAVDAKDTATLIDAVDFPQVKSSVKEQLKTKVAQEIPALDTADDGALLGAMFATAMVDGVVDAVITPKAVELILDGKDIGKQLALGDAATPQTDTADTATSHDWQYDLGYQSLDRFGVTLTKDNGKPVTVIMARDGLFDWKIVDVQLPLE
ncbi:DUF2939 domain-containing protein [uncultured Moraxella sp.]|uniref:DUF2939 domain-containing protein n=1 Tax=uncultured Moraxella sp. TaxID=263769 RepID=UPI0025E43976|nr:DUF2939 domain-containing protein [uncultured Moraxella sp.]